MLKRLWGGGSDKVKSIRVPVHAYGKLPIYKDFISCGLTDPAAKEFRVWLDRGFSHRWSTDDSCVGSEIPPHSFLVRLPESRGFAAGSLWGSSDEGGLRKFPFVLFLSFAKETDASDPVTAVEYLGEIERRASELRFVFGPGASLSSFYQTYRGTELDVLLRPREMVERELRSELSDFSVGDFAEALFGDASARAWPELLAAASNGAGGDAPGAVRLPLSGRLPRAREIEFWLLWLDRLDPRGRRAVTGVLYPHGHNPGRAVFFFRDLKPDDFLLLHPTRSDLPAVVEALSKVSGGAEITAAMRRKAARQTPAPQAAVEPTPEPVQPPQAAQPEPPAVPARSPSPAASPAPAEAVPPVAAVPAPVAAVPAPAAAEPPSAAPVAAADASPFPEADVAPSTVGGARLSAIVALDPSASGSVPMPEEVPPGPAVEAPETATESSAASGEASQAAPQPAAPAADPAPPPSSPASAPAEAAPAAPIVPVVSVAPVAPVAPAAPVFQPEPPPRTPNPPGWDRPLPSLLGA